MAYPIDEALKRQKDHLDDEDRKLIEDLERESDERRASNKTNFWQQIWQREKPWNTGDVVGTALQVPGEALDSLDRAVPIPGTKWSVYDARHAIIDPMVNRANVLDPTGVAGTVTNLAAEILIPDSTLYFGKLVKGVSKVSKALRGADLAFETAGAVSKASNVSDVSKGGNVMQIRTDPSKGILSPPKSSKSPEFGIGPQTLPMPGKVWKPKHVLKRYKDQLKQKGYTYVEKVSPDGTLKGGPKAKFGGQDFDLKWNEANAKGERTLKVKAKSSRLEEAAKRTSREKPWIRKKYEIQEILTKHGHSDKADSLINLIKKQYQSKVKLIKKDGLTIGHHKALENGGWDVAENIGGEIGKGKGGNYARGFRNDPPDEILQQKGAFTGTLEEYVLFKLPEVLK